MRYYSIQPSEMDEITNEDLTMLYNCIDIIDAKEALNSIKVAEHPYLTPEAQRKRVNGLKKDANPSILKKEARAISMEELASLIGKGV